MGKIAIDVKWLLVAVAVVTFGLGGYFMGNISSQASTIELEPETSTNILVPPLIETSSELTEITLDDSNTIDTLAAITPIESTSSEVNVPISSESSGVLAAPVSENSQPAPIQAPAALTLSDTQLSDMLEVALNGERNFQRLANIVSAIKKNGLAGVEFTAEQIDQLAAAAIPELTYAQDAVGDYLAVAGVSDTVLTNYRLNPEYSQNCLQSLGCGVDPTPTP